MSALICMFRAKIFNIECLYSCLYKSLTLVIEYSAKNLLTSGVFNVLLLSNCIITAIPYDGKEEYPLLTEQKIHNYASGRIHVIPSNKML